MGCAVSLHNYDDAKEQIRHGVDLVDLVSEHVSLKRAGRNLKGLCPFHKEKTPSFNVLPERQIFKCFGCQAGGDVFKFVQLIEGVEFSEAVRLLADRIGLELKPRLVSASGPPPLGRADIARANEWAAKWFRSQLLSDVGMSARAYVGDRRIGDEICERFEVGLAPAAVSLQQAAYQAGISPQLLAAADLIRDGDSGGTYDTFRDRLIFPIRDAGKRCVGFGGRTLGDSPAKYLNTGATPLFDKSRCLYGLQAARQEITSRGAAVLVEGYTDCIACHQHGFAHTVATLGTAATEEHMRTLRRYTDTAILLFDPDAAGQAAAERALAVALQQNLAVKIARLPEGMDPADYLQVTGPEEFDRLLNSAVDALVFMWNRTEERFRGSGGSSNRRQAVLEFVTLVGDLGRFGAVDAIQRGVIIHQVAELLTLPAEEVAGLLRARTARSAATSVPSPGMGRSVSVAARGGDAEQLILGDMLEILVCEPGLYGEVADVFVASALLDPTRRQIAEVVITLAGRFGEFDTAELIAGLESPDESRVVTDMIVRGAQREGLAEHLADLKTRLRTLGVVRDGRAASEEVRRRAAAHDAAELDANLMAIQQGCAKSTFGGAAHRGRGQEQVS